MHVDIILAPGTPAPMALELGQMAEDAGVRTVWASNFPARRDPYLSLVPLALATERLRLGVMPVTPFETQPVKMADTALTFTELASGRATLLVGGLGKSGGGAMGIDPQRRVTATREAVEIIRAAASGELVNYGGELYRANNYVADWACSQPPQLHVAANGPQMLSMAAACADGVMFSDATLTMLPGLLETLDRGLAAAGRERHDFELNNFFAWHIKSDKAAAVAEARRELVWRGVLKREYVSSFLDEEDTQFVEHNFGAFLQAFLAKTDRIEGVPERIIEALLENLTFTGGLDAIDHVVGELQQFAAAGLDAVALRMHEDPADSIKIIGERLIPALS